MSAGSVALLGAIVLAVAAGLIYLEHVRPGRIAAAARAVYAAIAARLRKDPKQ